MLTQNAEKLEKTPFGLTAALAPRLRIGLKGSMGLGAMLTLA
jgi:hypothetical protein